MNREEEFKAIKNKVREIIKSDSETTLEFDSEDTDRISFITRANGDVGKEEHSLIDLRDAVSNRNKITNFYGDKVEAFVEIIDEWVSLSVRII